MSYEENQARLLKMWQDCLSDEELDEAGDPFESEGSDDEYHPDEETSESESDTSSPQTKKIRKTVPCEEKPNTSKNDTISEIIEKVIRENTNSEDNSSESGKDNEEEISQNNFEWFPYTGQYLKNVNYSGPRPGFQTDLYEKFDEEPYYFYKMFITDEIIQFIVLETNRYGEQCLQQNVQKNSRIKKWTPTTPEEVEKFLGIVIWMGLCSLPTISSYWKKKKIYENIIPTIMSRNRFQLLLKTLHFSNNEVISEDRLQKLTPLLIRLKDSFQRPVIPSEYICIDETLVPFRGRLKFRQYISNKRHKFGIKLFKLCLKDGYTYDFQVYCGKSKKENTTVSTSIVMKLMNNLLDSGRTLCTDNYYTSVSLANSLLQRQTNLIGTLRTKRKYNPIDVKEKKLKIGETITRECKQGIIIQKWKDKRDVLMLSTKYGTETVTIMRRGKEIEKPKNVVEYNKYKSYIDISDQLKAYNTSLRRSMKWFRKLAFELMAGTAVVNAYQVYKEVTNKKLTITEFRELIVERLLKLKIEENTASNEAENSDGNHELKELGRNQRRRCVNCYLQIFMESTSQKARQKTPQSTKKCMKCDKHFCVDCFFETHSAQLKK